MSRIKFVKEMGNERKKMLAGIVIAAAIIISAVTIFTIPTEGNGNSPQVVIVGYVYYQNGTVVKGAFVNITDVANGNYTTNYTDSSGQYQVYFNFPNAPGASIGDKLVGFANDSLGLYGSNDTVFTSGQGGRIWLNITLGTPVTNKTLTGMKCLNGEYITLNTTFNFTAWDPNGDGINATYVRIWHNGWYPTPGTGKGKNNNFYIYDNSSSYGIPKNFTLWQLNQTKGIPAGEGTYYIEFYSDDKNTTLQGIEYTHNQTHIVDETMPTSSYSYGNPKVWIGQPNLEAIIGPHTPFYINATDTISGVRKIEYAVWRNMTHPGDWSLVDNATVYYDNSNGQNRSVSLPLYFDEGCYYEVTWNVTDCVDHVSKDYTAEFAVDVKPPSISWQVGAPNYTDEHGNRWINCSTPIWINVTDNGCGAIQAGVNRTVIKIKWNETQGSYFNYEKTIVVYDGDSNDSDGLINGEIHYKLTISNECFHEIRVWAYDNVENYAADKKQFFVDCKPPWVNKTISKVPFLEQMKNESSVEITDPVAYPPGQNFTANWSYVDAINVSICAPDGGNFTAKLWKGNTFLGETENVTVDDNYCGWLQLHFKNRIYLEHGANYTFYLINNNGQFFYWNGTNASTNPWVGDSIVNSMINDTWDFAFKLEYYPIYPYFYPMEYSFKNGSYEHNGLNETWITSKAFFHLAYGDEGCMGGVGVESVKYRIWNESSGWSQWMNYTTPFNISDECKHYIEVNVTDHLGQSTILNQTHYVDNSPPTDVVDIPDVHGYYNYNGKQYIRAGKGIWINLTDMPSCHPVGLREATFYWRYTYTNFTTPIPEEHPNSTNDVHYGFNDIVEIDGKYWYVVHLDQQHYSVFINFSRECMHDIYYFYNATDWLDNNITSEIKHIRLYVDEHEPIAWADYPWHYYQGDEAEGHIRAGANFTLYAKDMPNPIPMVCIAQMQGSQRDSLQPYPRTWPWDAQSFVAQCHHINETRIYLNWSGPANITVYVHNSSSMSVLGSSTVQLTGSGEGWVSFVFNPGIDTTIGETYYIEVHSEGNKSVDWFYCQSNPYAGGYATISGVPHGDPVNGSFDWRFQIISNEENPCASGAEGIYYGYYYNGDWYPNEPGEGVLNISKYYNNTEIQNAFMGHYLWYVINDSSSLDNDARHGYIEANVSFNEECQHDFYYWAKDNVCHHSQLYHHVFYVDDSAPEANIEMPSCYNPINDTIFYENFSTNPQDWTIYNFSGNAIWQWNSTLQAMVINDTDKSDDNWDSLVSPEIDCTNYDEVYLQYDLKYSQTDDFYVNVSNDGGATWNNVWHHPMEEPSPGDVVTIDISDIAAGHTIIVNFTYTSHNEKGNATLYFVKVYGYGYRGYISCNAAMHLNAFDYPVTNGKLVDQEQTTGNFFVYDAIENISGLYTAQSFIPTVDKLDAVELYLRGTGYVNVTIYDSGLNIIGYKNMSINAPAPARWIQFDFSPSISLIPGETYWLSVASYPNWSVSWLWILHGDNYPNGIMIRTGEIDTAHDYAFKTEYYSENAPAECSAGLEGIYYGYEYNGIWHPANESDNISEHGMVFNISHYYSQDEINSEFGGHTLWYVYDNNLGIKFFNECQHDLYYWAKDNVCHHSIVYHRVLYVDNSEPVITKTHPSCYEVVNGTPYLRAGANITLYADDMPANSCSSGTWLYWRYVWNNSGNLEYYPNFYYFEGFENGFSYPNGWAESNMAHTGNHSAVAYSSNQGWFWLNLSLSIPVVNENNKVFLVFWQRADNLNNYDASNIFGVYNVSGFIPLKFFYKDDMSNEWQRVIIDLTPYAGQSIKLAWVYENDYGDGELWFIDDVEVAIWNATYGYDNVTQNISFSNDCVHTLYYFAGDTTCHYTMIYNQTYHVDGTAPETGFYIETNCTNGAVQMHDYWQACDWANISFRVDNDGTSPCIDPNTFTYVRYEKWNESKQAFDKYPNGNGVFINGEWWYNITDSMYLNLTGRCNYTVYYFSLDGVCNVETVKQLNIHIDDMPPVTKPYFPNFNCGEVPIINGIYFINRHTLIGLDATDYPVGCASGVADTLYRVWKYNDDTGQFDIPLTDTWEYYSSPINLTDLVNEYDYHHSTNYGVCGAYEMWFYSEDNCCHTEDMNRIDIIVDCNPPTTEKNFAGLYVKGKIEGVDVTWVGRNTTIWFNATDGGEEEMRSGVKEIYWEIVNNTLDELNHSLNPNINDKDYDVSVSVNDLINQYGLSDGRYDLFHWAVDRVCNKEITDHKQWIVIDTSAPDSMVEQQPNCYHDTVPFDITVTDIHDNGYNGGVGVCKVELWYRYSSDNSTWGPWTLYAVNTSLITNDGSVADWTLSFMPPAGERNGYFQFKSIAYDCLNNVEQPPFVYGEYDAWCHVIVDHEGPNVTKEYGQPNVYMDLGGGEMGHAITSHTVIYINATDLPDEANASGIDKIYWSFDGMNWHYTPSYNGEYTASYSFTPSDLGLTEGFYQIFVEATDMLGQVSDQLKQKFVIDDTAPSSEANATCEGDTIYVKATASDNFVGVEEVELFGRYSEDGVNWTAWASYGYGTYNASSGEWEWKLENMSVGYYEFYSIATDYLGNVEVKTMADTSCHIKQYPAWDVNMDGSVNVLDMIAIASHWMESGNPGWIREDVNKDGIVNILDLIIVGQHFGEIYDP